MSCMAPRPQSDSQPEKAILNLRGRFWQIGLRRKSSVAACAYGVMSKASVPQAPASGHPVMLRTVL